MKELSEYINMNARFYAPDAHASDQLVRLPEDEATHLTRVLRLKRGDRVRVFNGRGSEYDAVIEDVKKTAVVVRTAAAHPAAVEPRVAITLAQAVLKGDKMDDVIRDAVMLGVAAVQPLLTTRTEVSRAMLARGNRRERWERVAISAVKQCGRAVVPAVHEPIALDELVAGRALFLVEPGADAAVSSLSEVLRPSELAATIVIGPEGGWTPEEIARASSSCTLVTLGQRTIRADAMAVVALSALFAIWREF